MKYDKITFCLPAWSIVVLVNDDRDTVTDDELKALNLFLNENGLTGCPMSVGDHEYFCTQNDVEKLGGNCYDVTFLRPAKDTTRKTLDTYEIWANYGCGPESVTGSENRQDAKRLLEEYRANERSTHHWIKKVRVPNPDYIPTPFERIVCKVDCTYGAPMGRQSVFIEPGKENTERVYDRKIPLDSGGYDKMGAYWGHGAELRVRYTKTLSYVFFYRKGEINLKIYA